MTKDDVIKDLDGILTYAENLNAIIDMGQEAFKATIAATIDLYCQVKKLDRFELIYDMVEIMKRNSI